jgi:hypothetical protein
MKTYPIILLIICATITSSCYRKIIGAYETEGANYAGRAVMVGEGKKLSIVSTSCTSGEVLRGYYKSGLMGIHLKTIDTDDSKINEPYVEIVKKSRNRKGFTQFEFKIFDNTTWFQIPSAKIIGEAAKIDSNKFNRALRLTYKNESIPSELAFVGDGYKKYNIKIKERFEPGYRYKVDVFLDFDGMEDYLYLKKATKIRVRIKKLKDDRIELKETFGYPIFPDRKIKVKLKRMRQVR